MLLTYNSFLNNNYSVSKKKKKEKDDPDRLAKQLQRKLAKQQGYYDGRFMEKRIPDKKKERQKKLARKKVKQEED
ncbi:MAG: hypothetical protein DWQ44_04830 [Bacteroidetes bacterium]|nr:MAG: hypothetical protein DWQ33_10960 [Bacteroidota bacterium]REK00609.1 MAG: hypothetical protein DWQ39_10635 [Bacteroidota bacterium]REK35269.1 MAG: hypothetical protein DWQ44_04830 [Bacteroidota bacterium]REK48345.1 MAG: hypothetical protein DWQ48_11030 [Bacteroidota bacterium]